MNKLSVVIPAVKKNVAFPDDLVKKLAGKSLLQRAVEKALEIAKPENVHVVTDSDEIKTFAERAGVRCEYDKKIYFKSLNIVSELKEPLKNIAGNKDAVVILSPYSPLLSSSEILKAAKTFRSGRADIMLSVINEPYSMIPNAPKSLDDLFDASGNPDHARYADAFIILSPSAAAGKTARPGVSYFHLDKDHVEIKSYRDWWVCEKLIARKRIVFRVIGNDRVGMGHIFRSMALAHEITDHEVIFVCSEADKMAVNSIAGYDYLVEEMKEKNIEKGIVKLAPHLVVNDMLDTSASYVMKLRDAGIKTVNFEDLGSGAKHSDLVINELYNAPPKGGAGNTLWGHDYYFLRDEFYDARPAKFSKNVKAALLTFGGTDKNNLTMASLQAVANYCAGRGIKIHIVAGPGYAHKKKLEKFIREVPGVVEFTHATGVISGIMEQVQLAVTSNGRTVYELAHMNVPSIVISHHERECLHRFSCLENGFVPMGVYKKGSTEKELLKKFSGLVEDVAKRKSLYDAAKKFDFKKNKSKVVRLLLDIVE